MNAAAQHNEAVFRSKIVCNTLAFLAMATTIWYIVQGIQATEPDSPARYARMVSGALMVVIEAVVFAQAGKWQQFSFVLRLLGWAIFALNIAMMTLANYSVAVTADKTAASSKDTAAEVKAQAQASRDAAKALNADAAKMRASKHEWIRAQASAKSDEAAKQTAAAQAAADKLERLQAAGVSTPNVETIGKVGQFILSFLWAAIFEVTMVVLMHVAGSLRDKAGEVEAATAPAPAQKPAPAPEQDEPAKRPPWLKKEFGFVGEKPGTNPVNVDTPPSVNPVNVDTPSKDDPANVDTPAAAARRARVISGVVMDTGVGAHDGYRFRRALEGIRAGTIRLSVDGLYAGVKASRPTAKRYIAAWAEAGEIERNAEDTAWVLVVKKGGAK